MKKYRHLTWADRIKIEALVKANFSQAEIARQLDVNRSTICRELKRGRFYALKPDLEPEERYSPDIADQKYKDNLKAKGPELKIGKDRELAEYIERQIVEQGYSPEAALLNIKAEKLQFRTEIKSVQTLYSYITKGIFLHLTNQNLPVKGRNKSKKRKVRKIQAKAAAGPSIEKRPEEIDSREEFGHWEMDTVKGKQGVSKKVLLVLTERKTREELLRKMDDGTTQSVIHELDKIETSFGDDFKKVFKTITVDNGSEFADVEGMEASVLNPDVKRVKLFYCHPYSSYERGSNENANKLVRRKIPKGSNFDMIPEETISDYEQWINSYPRRLFGYRSAGWMFQQELEKLCLSW